MKEFCILQKIDMVTGSIFYQNTGLRCEDYHSTGALLIDTSPFDLFLVLNTQSADYLSSFSLIGGPITKTVPPTYQKFSESDSRQQFSYRDELVLRYNAALYWRFLSLASYTTYFHPDKYGFMREYYPVIAIVTMESSIPFQHYVFLLNSIEVDVSPPYTSSQGLYVFAYENWFTTALLSFILVIILIVGLVLCHRAVLLCWRRVSKARFERLY